MVPVGSNRTDMKHLISITILLVALTLSGISQTVEYVDDEECGCSLVFVDGIQTTQEGDLFGFKRADGTVIVPNIYRYVDRFQGDYCRVYLGDRQCGLIDREGRTVVPCRYDGMEYPSEGRVLVASGGLYGFCDLRGNEVVEPQYIQAGSFSEGMAPVLVEIDSFYSACTMIDTNGRFVFQPVFENIMPFHDGYAVARRYQRWGVINQKGQEMTPYIYEFITIPQNGYFFAGDSAGMAFFDYRFKPLTPFVYQNPRELSEGRIAVQRDGRWGFLDIHGREVVPCIYDDLLSFSSGRAMVRKDGKYGIIDTDGRIVLPIEYENNTSHGDKYVYHDSLALVEKDGKLGYVDLEGNLTIPFYFDEAFHFTQGYACAKFKGAWGYINRKGDIYIPFVFQYASPFEWGRAEVVYEGNVSNIDLRGKCVKNCNGIIAWRDWTKEEE